MDFKKLIKAFLPHGLTLVSLLILNVLFFSPLIQGKKLKQEDISQFESVTRFNKNLDSQSLTDKYLEIFNVNLDQSLWTDNMLGGMPTCHSPTVID